jgi:hypothetical protein
VVARIAKWLFAIAVTLVIFGLCLWVGWVAGIRLWPHTLHSFADRWVVSAAFATVMGGAVLAWGGWWASRERESTEDDKLAPPSLSIQDVHASGGGSAYGVMHGSQHIYHHPPVTGPGTRAPTEDSQEDQIGDEA